MGFITIEGESQIAAKQANAEVLNITNFVLANIDGLGAEPADRIETMPAAGDIVATLAVTKAGYLNPNQVVYSLVMDSAIGDFDFNWVGLVDDEGIVVAVTYTPVIQKRATSGGVPGNNLTRNFLIAYSGVQATAAVTVPAETWQIDFNARLHGIDERERLSNADIYGHEGFISDAFMVSRDGATTTYNVEAGVAYVGGIRIEQATQQQVTVATPPGAIWLDVSLQGDISDVSPVVNFVIDNAAHSDYTDGNGFDHYLTKLADIAGDGTVTDARANAISMAEHLAATDPHSQYVSKTQTANVEVGYTTNVETLNSDSITPDMTKEAIKKRAVAGDITINFPTGGNGVCYLSLAIDATDRSISLGANVEPVGTMPVLKANGKYLVVVVRESATEAMLQVSEVG